MTEKTSVNEVNSNDWLEAIRKAWKEYNEINGSYSYHLEEGGDPDCTREDVSQAWSKLNDLMASNDSELQQAHDAHWAKHGPKLLEAVKKFADDVESCVSSEEISAIETCFAEIDAAIKEASEVEA